MRIAIYLNHLERAGQPGGVGKHMIHMTQGLAQAPGVDVQVLTPKQELVNGVIPPESPFRGLPVRGLPLPPSMLHRAWLLTGQPKVDRYSPNADWIYCSSEIYIPTRRIPLAATCHDMHAMETYLPWSNTSHHKLFKRRWSMKMQKILDHARLVLSVSEFTKSRIIEFFRVPPERIVVIGNGVESLYFDAEKSSAKPETSKKGPYVFAVGGLTLRKGGDRMLKLAAALKARKSPLRVIVAGRGEDGLDAVAAEYKNVELLGYRPLHEVASLMNASVAVLVLSRYEGFGIPALEAMAAGAPVVVSGDSALPETVANAGMVVNADDAEELASRVVQLADDQALRRRYIDLGRARANGFTWESCVSKLLDAFAHARC